MMTENFTEIQKRNLEKIINREREFSFADFLKIIRCELGVSRDYVSKQAHVSSWQLYRWERGEFVREIHVGDLLNISDYYSIPFKLLVRKMNDHLMNKRLG